MPFKLTFRKSAFLSDTASLRRGMKTAAEKGMLKVVKQAVKDARFIAQWRQPARTEKEYPDGVTWEWEPIGMARTSIQGYLVGKKNLYEEAPTSTFSYRTGADGNRVRLLHPNVADNSVTEDYAEDPNRVVGIVTMNAAYAPFLQDWEVDSGPGKGNLDYPAVVEVLDANWEPLYVPGILVPEIDAALDAVARRLT